MTYVKWGKNCITRSSLYIGESLLIILAAFPYAVEVGNRTILAAKQHILTAPLRQIPILKKDRLHVL